MRKLLAILAADVANYSAHIERNESDTLLELHALRAIMDAIIIANRGAISNTAGDSVVARFESAVDALQAASEIQQAHSKHNLEVNPANQLWFRIGLNVGEVTLQESGDILGHGVNIAARLEAISEPGGICLSEGFMSQVEGKVEFEFTKIGEYGVKNLRQPIKVYAVGEKAAPSLLSQIMRLMKHPSAPIYQFGFTGVVAIIGGLAIWSFGTNPDQEVTPDSLDQILATDPTPKELLQSFDLVTTGTFEGHTYHIIRTWGGTWADVQALASALRGYPVAIGTPEENAFLFELSLKDEGHWKRYGTAHEGPLIGLIQDEDADEPDGGWRWENGDPVNFSNWAPGSPDNYRGNQNLATFANPRVQAPSPKWGDSPVIHNSVVIEVPK